MENLYETHSEVYEQSTACGSVPKAKQEHRLKANIKDIQPQSCYKAFYELDIMKLVNLGTTKCINKVDIETKFQPNFATK